MYKGRNTMRLPHLTSIGMTLVNNIHVILIYIPVRCAGG